MIVHTTVGNRHVGYTFQTTYSLDDGAKLTKIIY